MARRRRKSKETQSSLTHHDLIQAGKLYLPYKKNSIQVLNQSCLGYLKNNNVPMYQLLLEIGDVLDTWDSFHYYKGAELEAEMLSLRGYHSVLEQVSSIESGNASLTQKALSASLKARSSLLLVCLMVCQQAGFSICNGSLVQTLGPSERRVLGSLKKKSMPSFTYSIMRTLGLEPCSADAARWVSARLYESLVK